MSTEADIEATRGMVLHHNPDVIFKGLCALNRLPCSQVLRLLKDIQKEMDKTGYFMALSKAVIVHYIETNFGA